MATFGYTTMGAISWAGNIDNKIVGSIFTCPQNGTANSITAGLIVTDVATRMKCAIYRASDRVLIGQTEEVLVPRSPTVGGIVQPVWTIFNFSTPPTLYGGVQYCLVVWSYDEPYTASYIQYDPGVGSPSDPTTWQALWFALAYGAFPATLPSFTRENRICSIYCDYTVTGPPQQGTLTVHAKTA